MYSLRKQRYLLVICLVLAGVIYRGLIPAGFMPASGSHVAGYNAFLVICRHGEMASHDPSGTSSDGSSLEQCPFGAAAGPAAPSVKVVFSFAPVLAVNKPVWNIVSSYHETPQLQPPVRGPPVLS